ncbi:nickel/cobalt efflux transporter [Bradyrhizobium sp. WD16]|uniref:nickel/cobalt efflux transporter n=1 Tax=Bradyrhizobium sp. WD16 TaxID=1521768 RepID=UPI0020A52A70|nr:nickel/cobalt efflux transporter [Bradyrhizobium sp. WD16]UTD26431.1 nickel/cobalt efflux protein RcnA [Bradyrhizobium sp. WD16]
MTELTALLQQGAAHAWLFAPTAVLLGALHGLEPGHSKTMMAAFIIAIRGTIAQAVLLGLSAALSHTAVVWTMALGGLAFGQHWGGEAAEPYFQLGSAVVILGIAGWMTWRTWREQHEAHHHHHDDVRPISATAGLLTLAIIEDGVPPRWRLCGETGVLPAASSVTIETRRADGARQTFAMAARGDHLESLDIIPEPHAFTARLRIDRGSTTAESHDLDFAEHDPSALDLGEEDDAHARAHAAEIRRRFAGGSITTAQIMLFGLTGGLIPCPAAITVLLLCIQLRQLSLGFALVICFGLGLALTMVSAGVLAALSLKHIAGRWSGFTTFARRAPYVSAAVIVLVGLYTGWLGWQGLSRAEAQTLAAPPIMTR